MIAAAVKADQLIMLSNVPGLLKNFPDESSLIATVAKNELEDAMQYAEGRFKKKVMGAAEALDYGVGQVVFADARIEQPITAALNGKGTVIS